MAKKRKNELAGHIIRNGGVLPSEPIRIKRNGVNLIKSDSGELVEEFD